MSGWLIAPYAAWMALMMMLPSAPWAYAVRTGVTLALLIGAAVAAVRRRERAGGGCAHDRGTFAAPGDSEPSIFRFSFSFFRSQLLPGAAIGLLVLAIWIAPDSLDWYRRFCVVGDPYSAAAPLDFHSPLTWIQLFGSAFVISAAEELFFRKWLLDYAGFWWMLGLFAVEHNRPLVAAIAGALYAFAFLRFGLPSAIIAHAVTNLGLGIYVLAVGAWQFW